MKIRSIESETAKTIDMTKLMKTFASWKTRKDIFLA